MADFASSLRDEGLLLCTPRTALRLSWAIIGTPSGRSIPPVPCIEVGNSGGGLLQSQPSRARLCTVSLASRSLPIDAVYRNAFIQFVHQSPRSPGEIGLSEVFLESCGQFFGVVVCRIGLLLVVVSSIHIREYGLTVDSLVEGLRGTRRIAIPSRGILAIPASLRRACFQSARMRPDLRGGCVDKT